MTLSACGEGVNQYPILVLPMIQNKSSLQSLRPNLFEWVPLSLDGLNPKHAMISTCVYRINESLHNYDALTKPWERVYSDTIGLLPMTLNRNKLVIIFIDALSKFIIAEPIPEKSCRHLKYVCCTFWPLASLSMLCLLPQRNLPRYVKSHSS